jgi:hypothetical protein
VARQVIKYETTAVEPGKSAAEIAQLVQVYGGSRFEMQWASDGLLTGIRFALRHPTLGEIPIRLVARIEKIDKLLQNSAKWRWHRDRKLQAHRIAWRQLKDFIEQQLLAVKTGLFLTHEVFMAQVEASDPETGVIITIGELVERYGALSPKGGLRLLPAPPTLEGAYEVER